MGKVGSTALEKVLSQASSNVHTLYDNHPCPYNHRICFLGMKRWLKEKLTFLIKHVLFLLRKEVKIVTLYRDPVERNISMFMQDYIFWHSLAFKNQKINGKMENVELPKKIFFEQFDHKYCFDWFDKELKKLTKINVYDYGDEIKRNGYKVIQNGKYKVLVINYKALNQSISEEDVIKFFGVKMVLPKVNSASDKWYSDIYLKFKNDWKEEVCDFYNREFSNTDYYKLVSDE